MTSAMKSAALFALLLALPAAAGAESLTVTGGAGGTAVIARDCSRSPGLARCTTTTALTGPQGATASRSRQRVTSAGQSQTLITATGPRGQSHSRSRMVLVSR